MPKCSNRIQAPGRWAIFCQCAHIRVIQFEKQINKNQNQTPNSSTQCKMAVRSHSPIFYFQILSTMLWQCPVTCNFPHRDAASHLQSFADVAHPSKMTSPTLFEQVTTKQDLILLSISSSTIPDPLNLGEGGVWCVCLVCVCVLSKSLPRSNSLSISTSAIPDPLNLIGCLLHTRHVCPPPQLFATPQCVCVSVCECTCPSPTLCNTMDCVWPSRLLCPWNLPG